MKATELMIGDWVISEIEGAGRITELGRDWIVALTYGNNNNAVTDELRHLQLIPLTSKILENNGFGIDDGFHPHRFWKSADNRIILHNEDEYLNTFNKWHVHVDTEDMRTIGSIELTYVHQFQQFLRLCGMNELANNFKV